MSLEPLFDPPKEPVSQCLLEWGWLRLNRLKLNRTHDHSSYWNKVVDAETGEIVGGALWNIHKENPFASPDTSEVTWFPNDGSRSFAESTCEL